MGVIDLPDSLIHHSDNEKDRIVNSFYCGQIQALHHLVYFLWRSRGKYSKDDIFTFVESRYCYLIREYPNFYNQIIKNEQQLGKESDNAYRTLFVEMMEHFKDITKNAPKV